MCYEKETMNCLSAIFHVAYVGKISFDACLCFDLSVACLAPVLLVVRTFASFLARNQ